ncbi:MAG: PAS domain S-box protein [Lentisphaeraceae bacterium]|nr:PAS domain S-box protein [Lentisphaeraceae bacterium]
MPKRNKLSTTTVRIDLPDEYLNSLIETNSAQSQTPATICDFNSPVYRELLNNTYDAVIITDTDGYIRDFNQHALKFFHYKVEGFSARCISELVSGLDESLLEELIGNAQKKLRTIMEANCTRKDLSEFPAEITANEIFLNEENFIIFCIRNISHRIEVEQKLQLANDELNARNELLKKREKELAKEKELFDILLNQVPEYIFFKDKDSKFTRINQAMAAFYGLDSAEEAIGKSSFDLLKKEMAKVNDQEDIKIQETGEAVLNHEECMYINDQEIWLTTSKVPIRNIDDEITGLVGISRDTTEKKIAIELLRDAKHKAEEANKLKNDFIANITHELRTPLNPIIGFTTIIKNGFAEYTNNKILLEEHTDYILEAATHLQSIIDDLLTVASNTTLDVFKITTFSANALIAEIVNLHHYQIIKNKLDLKLLLPHDFSILFHCDRGKLFHIVSNFISNAIKFTPTNGQIFIRLLLEGDELKFEVEDTGIGIKKENYKRIFERFTQAEHALTKTYGGTGLGLAIVKELCEVIGCTPYVISTYEVGSQFGIKIPASLFEVIHPMS